MNEWMLYLIKSGAGLCLFTTLYMVLLQRETCFRSNRFFLLTVLAFSTLLPFLRFPVYDAPSILLEEIRVSPDTLLIETVSVYGNEVARKVALSISTSGWVIGIYLLGLLFFFFRLLFRMYQLTRLIRKHEIRKYDRFRLVILDEDTGSFSFLSYVFVGRPFGQLDGREKRSPSVLPCPFRSFSSSFGMP